MNLNDIKQRVKRQFGDEAQVQISDIDIIRWANDGQRHITTHNPSVNQKIGLADIVKDQQTYLLPEDLFILSSLHIKYTGQNSYYHIESASLQEFDRLINGWNGTATASPSTPYIYNKYGNSINLFPIPNATVLEGMKLYYNRYPTDLSSNTDVIDLPIEYHTAVVDFCLQQAYELDEDWQASQAKAGQVLATLHVNKNREQSGSQETYNTITVLDDDL